jgi:hypothetical protein
MDQPGSNRVAAKKQSPPVVAAPKSVEPMAAAGDIGPIAAYEQLASLSTDGRPDPAHVLALQRAAGNRAVSRFMAGRTIQTKVNTEPAAGRSVAESTQRARSLPALPAPGSGRREASRSRARPAASPTTPAVRPPLAPRIARLEDEEMPGVPAPRPGAGFDASPDFESRLAAARGSGAPLPDATRAFMEQRIGANFGDVKVHTDARSDALNQDIQAKAFTTGQDVFFRQGEFEPATSGGKELIAHELTHVVQQTGAAMRTPAPEASVSIDQTSVGDRAIQAKGRALTTGSSTAPTTNGTGPTDGDPIPTLEEELIAEGVADTTSFAAPAQQPSGLAKAGASIKTAFRPDLNRNPVKVAIDKLDRAAVDRIVDLIAQKQLECTPQQLSWLGQRASAFEADPGSYETTLAQELTWERVATIAALDRPGLERILGLIQDKKLKVMPAELQQLGRRRQALMADASTYATTLAKELAFEQVKGISELDRDGLDRILTLIEDGKLMITPAERQLLGKRRVQVGGASTPGAVTLEDALAREGVETIPALDFDGVERVAALANEKKLTLTPAYLQQLGRRRSELEAAGNKAAKLSLDAALAREGVATIGQLDLLGVDGITDLIRGERLDVTLRQKQQLGERRQQLLRSAKTVTQYLKDKLAAEVAGGTPTKGTRITPISKLPEPECEAILELVGKRELRATNQEILDLSRFRKTGPAERERYETTFDEQLAWEGATQVDQLSVEAAERIRELVADKKLKVTTAQLQQLARLSKAKPAPGAEESTLEKELARHGAATFDELDLEGVEAIRRLDQEKKLDLGPDDQKELGRRYRLLQGARKSDEATLEMEMAREGLGKQEFDKLDLDGAERILGLVAEGGLRLEAPALLALGKRRSGQKAISGKRKTTLVIEMARRGATFIEELDLEGVEEILELTVAEEPLSVGMDNLRRLGQHRRELLKKEEAKRPTLAQELKLREAKSLDDLELEALNEIHELVVDGKLKLLPSQLEHLERRRKQRREEANADKPELEELLAWEGAENIAGLDLEAVDKILNQIRHDGLKVGDEALRDLVRRQKALSVAEITTGTLDEELAVDGALTIAELDSEGIDRIWGLVEGGKLNVTDLQLLELARRRKAYLAESRALETSLADELAKRDVDGIADLDFAGVRDIWKLVEEAALEISPDELRDLAQRRKAVLSASRTYETTLKYELARAKARTVGDLDMSDVSRILDLAAAGDLELSDSELARLVKRQKEDVYDGRALKALLADRKDRSIGSLKPLTVSILLELSAEGKLMLSGDQRRELSLRSKDQVVNPRTLEIELSAQGRKTIDGLDRNEAGEIWKRVLDREVTTKGNQLRQLARRAGSAESEFAEYKHRRKKKYEDKLAALESGIGQAKRARRKSVVTLPESGISDPESERESDSDLRTLQGELSSVGASLISELSYAEVESILAQIAEAQLKVTNDELRQLVRARNDELKKRTREPRTLERELSLEGVAKIAELDLDGADSIWTLVTSREITVDTEQYRELAKRRAELQSTRMPEALTLASELAKEGVVEIASLDAAGLERINLLVEDKQLKVSPPERRQLAQQAKKLQGPARTLAAALDAEGAATIGELDLEGAQRIIGLAESRQLKLEAELLTELYALEAQLNQDPAERITLVKELIKAGAYSIAGLDLNGVEGIIALIADGKLKVGADQIRELYQLDARLSAEDQVEVEGSETPRPESPVNPGGPTRRNRSDTVWERDFEAELARLRVPNVDGLGLDAVERLMGLVEGGKFKTTIRQRRRLYWRHAALAEPQSVKQEGSVKETLVVPDEPEDVAPLEETEDDALREETEELTPEVPEPQRTLALELARAGVEDIASLDKAGAERIRWLSAGTEPELSITPEDAAALGNRLRELERTETLGQMTFARALARRDAEDVADLDLEGVDKIRELIETNKINPIPANAVLLELGQRRKALLIKEKQNRTTLRAELDREEASGIGDLDLAGVERIRSLIADKKLEVIPGDLGALAQQRVDLLSKSGPGKPALDDELALEGVETIEALDLEGVNRIRSLIEARQLTVAPLQLHALGKRRMALLSSPGDEKATLEAELALEGVTKISDLDQAGALRIRELVGQDKLDISVDQLRELGLRTEALRLTDEPVEASLERELASRGVNRIADLDLEGLREIRYQIDDIPPRLKVTDREAEELRQNEALLSGPVTLSAFLDRVKAPNIAGLGREAIIDIWKRVEANQLIATEKEIREIAIKRKGLRVEIMKLSDYLADKRNAPGEGRDARTLDGLGPAEIGAILNLIEEKRLIAEPAELQTLARMRREQGRAPKPEPTTLSGALVQEGAKDIGSLGLDEIQRIWERVADRSLEATLEERKALGQRRRMLLSGSWTLKTAVAEAGASSIAELKPSDVIMIWDRVAMGHLSAELDERRLLGERRKRVLSDTLGGLGFELATEGVKDIASLKADAVERIWKLFEDGDLRLKNEELRELARLHNYETGYDVRIQTLEALADLTGEGPARPTVQTKLAVGPAGDRYEQEADRVARQVVRAPAPAQPLPVDEYYRGPAYPSSAAQRSSQAHRRAGG